MRLRQKQAAKKARKPTIVKDNTSDIQLEADSKDTYNRPINGMIRNLITDESSSSSSSTINYASRIDETRRLSRARMFLDKIGVIDKSLNRYDSKKATKQEEIFQTPNESEFKNYRKSIFKTQVTIYDSFIIDIMYFNLDIT